MRKVLLFSAIFCAVTANAQNYIISFTGTGAAGSVTTVKVENLMKGTSLTLNGSDILHLKGTVGINSVEYNHSPELKIYPNPMRDQSIMEIYPPVSGDASISIYEITGKRVFTSRSYLENGRHEFRISGLHNGLYLIDIKGKTYNISGKLLSDNNTYTNPVSVEWVSSTGIVDMKEFDNTGKGSMATVDMDYSDGDRLKFTGTSGNYSTVFMDIPAQDKTITFNFVPCTDYETNNYPVVVIGTQTWMAENLKSTKYNDGALIPLVSDSLEWLGLTTSGYCWYRNNETANKNIYGALYNFYAVSSGKLCPTGWHVPTDPEWTLLTTFLGGTSNAGGKIKETGTNHWSSPNTGATNESGFTGLPGGWRGSTSRFQELHVCGEFWTSTPYYDTGGYCYYLDYWYKSIYREYVGNRVGFSIRCVKD